jgi:Family of unknown function (DUF6256)
MASLNVLAASTDRQALVPMAAGYLILMSALAFGLYRLYRPKAARTGEPPGPSPARTGEPPGPSPAGTGEPPGRSPAGTEEPPGRSPAGTGEPPGRSPAGSRRSGWASLTWHVMGTVIGGYLLLQAVVVAYYYGVARVGPGFLESAVTGTALLLGLAAPVFVAASWLTERRQRSRPASTRHSADSHPAGQLAELPPRVAEPPPPRWPRAIGSSKRSLRAGHDYHHGKPVGE